MTIQPEVQAPTLWKKLPRNLRRVVCLFRGPTDSETLDLVALGLAWQRAEGTLSYTPLGFAVRSHGFRQHQKSRWN